jgi:hypothetical protein
MVHQGAVVRRCLIVLVVLLLVATACELDPDLHPLPAGVRRAIHVSSAAGDGGDGSASSPFATIGAALAQAGAGDAVMVHEGLYREQLTTVRAGRPGAPIRIIGDGARLVGDGDGRLLQILHDHTTLEGFDLSGADILVWVQQASGVRLLGNRLHDAGGECVRLKYFATDNEVAGNDIGPCGLQGFDLGDDRKNGEGVYIGTAPEQLGRNPSDDADRSDGNHVHDNVISVPAECVDVKEFARANVVEDNRCTGSRDPDGAGFSSRGEGTVFRNNVSSGHVGAGIRLGGDGEADGVGSVVIGNELSGNEGYGLKVMRTPQGTICGNRVEDNGGGAANDDAPDPTVAC